MSGIKYEVLTGNALLSALRGGRTGDLLDDAAYAAADEIEQLQRLLQKIMARCADLLDEDQFNELDAMTRAADSAPAVELWKPHHVKGRWAYWQCGTPNGPYNFQASSLDEAEAICNRERAAHSASVVDTPSSPPLSSGDAQEKVSPETFYPSPEGKFGSLSESPHLDNLAVSLIHSICNAPRMGEVAAESPVPPTGEATVHWY